MGLHRWSRERLRPLSEFHLRSEHGWRRLTELEERHIREWAAPLRGGRPPAAYHWDWARRLEEFRAEFNGSDYESPVEGENARLSDFELRILVAIEDYEAHPERWTGYDPKTNRRAAADRVDKALKRLS